jgi:catechol 2,3-dioxygenase-like lactoylglutathione lyase family enzyme
MEMKGRESCGTGDVAKPQWFTQSIDDVIDRAIDALNIRRRGGRARFFGGSQDLTSLLASVLSNEVAFSGHNCGVSREPTMNRSIRSFVLGTLAACLAVNCAVLVSGQQIGATKVRLGNFSVSLAVKDLKASREFYEKLGFRVIGGDAKRWAILQNETSTIGLFQGMFERNCLTYNPGWDRNSATLPDFDDVRAIQRELKTRGFKLLTEADEESTGPASFVLADPDGNPILVDQHVPKPAK